MLRFADAGMAFSLAKDRDLSLWNEVPLTLIARRWPCAFFLSDSKGMLDVKDTVLRRELASIALATRKTKNFFAKCCQRLGPVKDTVLRRELASIALATRKTTPTHGRGRFGFRSSSKKPSLSPFSVALESSFLVFGFHRRLPPSTFGGIHAG